MRQTRITKRANRVRACWAAAMLCATVVAWATEPPSAEVVHTGKAPTGYTVTFRYTSPTAKRVQIKGEWYFARPADLTRIAATPEHPIVEGQGLLPTQWRPGDFPLQHPNSTAGNWPVADMRRGQDGVWAYTVPLPSGVFNYRLLIDGSATPFSEVFVPSDPAFDTVDYRWQGPANRQGKLALVTCPSHDRSPAAHESRLVVYTPPGYDSSRKKPYPTLYLSHGGGENEMGWSREGDVGNILDNLIGDGEIQPIVVVMPNAQGLPNADMNEAYDRDIIDNVIPYVEKHYHVSTAAADRAFAGLSLGGMLTNSFIIKHPEVFQYYGMMSAGLPPDNDTLSPAQIAALRGKSIWIGGGWEDVIFAAGWDMGPVRIHTGPAREVSTFARAGIPATTDFIHGGHEWYVWRILLKDFLTRVAFLPQPYAAWEASGDERAGKGRAAIRQ